MTPEQTARYAVNNLFCRNASYFQRTRLDEREVYHEWLKKINEEVPRALDWVAPELKPQPPISSSDAHKS